MNKHQFQHTSPEQRKIMSALNSVRRGNLWNVNPSVCSLEIANYPIVMLVYYDGHIFYRINERYEEATLEKAIQYLKLLNFQ